MDALAAHHQKRRLRHRRCVSYPFTRTEFRRARFFWTLGRGGQGIVGVLSGDGVGEGRMGHEASRHLRRIDRGELRTDPNFQAPPMRSYAESSMPEAQNHLGGLCTTVRSLSGAMFRVRRAHEAIGIPSLHRVPTIQRDRPFGHAPDKLPSLTGGAFTHARNCCAPWRLPWCSAPSSAAVLHESRVHAASVGLSHRCCPGPVYLRRHPACPWAMAYPSDPPPPFLRRVVLGRCLFVCSWSRIWRYHPLLFCTHALGFCYSTSTSGSLIADSAPDDGIVGQ
ncbi:hypothetical protein GSI_00784 [Ganoderma sinense ZZ0214-1]|uniref:Uncharacterized protein n=1 Tax=Ganoderma sinense ZZ0214-1 TaxID=1077348 RepID=A0A2G8STN4_9APHY|nr:hypothetical protein GSI_00784 [Ganoderma sinense ZZ0214-1]